MVSIESSELLWFVVGLIMMLGELALRRFVVIFLGIGAWITALCVALRIVESFNGELAIFLITSILTLVLFRKRVQDYYKGRVPQRAGPTDAVDRSKGQ